MSEKDEFLTPNELVERYKNSISERTLANWRSSGDGPPYTKIGGRVLYPSAAVEKWERKRSFGSISA